MFYRTIQYRHLQLLSIDWATVFGIARIHENVPEANDVIYEKSLIAK